MLANRSRFVRRLSPPIALLAVLLAGGCVPAPAPAPAPPPLPKPAPTPSRAPVAVLRPALPAPPPPVADWRDAPQTGGTWKWGMDGESSVARFGEAGVEPLATLTCDAPSRTVMLRMAGGMARSDQPAAGGATVIVTTTGARQMYTADGDAAGGGTAVLAATDPMLDAIVFSRGRFMLEMPGASMLYLPSWPELSRVVEDCRQEVVHRPEAGPKP